MDFSLTDAQQEIARLAGQLLDDGKADPWKELARAGLLALSLPADLGGEGLGVMSAAVLLTEVGRRAVPVPALATLMTGLLPVVRWGDGELQRALLPPAAAGEQLLTAGIREPSDPLPRVPSTTVSGGTVTGIKVGVPYGAEAGHVLLPVRFASREGPEVRTGVVIIDPAADGAHVTRTGSAAGAPEYTLRLDRAPVEHVLGAADCAGRPVRPGGGGRVLPGRRRPGRGPGADQEPRRAATAVRPAAGGVPGRRPADRGCLHRLAHPASGHPVGVLAARHGPGR